MKIAVDAMGGDLAPREVVRGAVMAAREFDLRILLVGRGAGLGDDRLNRQNRAGIDFLRSAACSALP